MKKIFPSILYFFFSLVLIRCSSITGPESDAKGIADRLCKCSQDNTDNSLSIIEKNIEKLKKLTDLSQIENIAKKQREDILSQGNNLIECKKGVEQEYEKIKLGYEKDWKKIRRFENTVDSLNKTCRADFFKITLRNITFDSLADKLIDQRSISEMPKEPRLILLDMNQKKYGFDPFHKTIFNNLMPYGNDYGNFYLLPIAKHGVAVYFYFYREKYAYGPTYKLASMVVNLEKKTTTNTENIILYDIDYNNYDLLSAENVNIFLSPDNKYMVITDKDSRNEMISRVTIFDLLNGDFEKYEFSSSLFGLSRSFHYYLKNFSITKNNKAILKVDLKEYYSDYKIDNQTIEFDLPTRQLTSSLNQN